MNAETENKVQYEVLVEIMRGRVEWLWLRLQIEDALDELVVFYTHGKNLETRGTAQFEKLAPLLARAQDPCVKLAAAACRFANDKSDKDAPVYSDEETILKWLDKAARGHALIALREQEAVLANDTLPAADRAAAADKAISIIEKIEDFEWHDASALNIVVRRIENRIDGILDANPDFTVFLASYQGPARLASLQSFFNERPGLPLEVRAEQMLVASESEYLLRADKFRLAEAADQMAGAALDIGVHGAYAKNAGHDAIRTQQQRIADEAREALKVNGVTLAADWWKVACDPQSPMENRRRHLEWFDDVIRRAGLDDDDIHAACNGGIYGGGQNNWREVMRVRGELLDFALKDFMARTGHKPRERALAP